MIDSNTDILKASGAKERDKKVWGAFHYGKDTVETLKTFIEEKIAQLDDYYGAFLEGTE